MTYWFLEASALRNALHLLDPILEDNKFTNVIIRHDRTCRSVRDPLSPFSSHTHANIILAANPPLSRPFPRFKPSASRTSLSATLPLSLVTPTRRSTSVTAPSALDLHVTRVSRVRRKLTRHVSAKDVKAVTVCWYVLLLLPL